MHIESHRYVRPFQTNGVNIRDVVSVSPMCQNACEMSTLHMNAPGDTNVRNWAIVSSLKVGAEIHSRSLDKSEMPRHWPVVPLGIGKNIEYATLAPGGGGGSISDTTPSETIASSIMSPAN
jgi:hypothetical protein